MIGQLATSAARALIDRVWPSEPPSSKAAPPLGLRTVDESGSCPECGGRALVVTEESGRFRYCTTCRWGIEQDVPA